MKTNKIELREKFKKITAALKPKYLKSSQKVIDNKVCWFIQHYELKSICLYYSYDLEVKTLDIIKFALKNGVQVYLPRVFNNTKMEFYRIKSSKDLVKNKKFRFKEPKASSINLLTDVNDVQAIFIPLITFDRNLNRIGTGNGYYDRWLTRSGYSGYKIGLSREVNLSHELIIAEPHDVKLDFIITDENVYVQLDNQETKDYDVTYWRLNEEQQI